MVSRRTVLGAGAVAGAALLVPVAFRSSVASAKPVPGGTLDPTRRGDQRRPVVRPAARAVTGGGRG
jgi:hypothetical protein